MIRYSHPNLYKGILTFAVINIALGFNFWFANPTFNPYNIDKTIIGTIFFVLGFGETVFLILPLRIKMIRLLMALNIGFILFWGIGTSITAFQGITSFQLFILYTGLAALQLWQLLEPVINPMTETKHE